MPCLPWQTFIHIVRYYSIPNYTYAIFIASQKLLSNTPSPLDDIADVVIIGVVSAKARQLLVRVFDPSEQR